MPRIIARLAVALLAFAFLNSLTVIAPAQDEPPESATPAKPANELSPFADPGETAPAEEPPQIEVKPESAPPDASVADSPFAAPGPINAGETPSLPAQAPSDRMQSYATPSGEDIRGLYVSSSTAGYRTIEEIAQLVEAVRSAGFNRLYPEVRTVHGLAFDSPTARERRMSFVNVTFANPVLEIRKALGSRNEIFATVDVLTAYSAVTGTKPPAESVLANIPTLRNQNYKGDFIAPDNNVYLDPGNSETFEYLSAVLLSVDSGMLPEGYLLKGVAYPGIEWGYSDRAIREFRAIVGGSGPPTPDDPIWCSYRRDRLTKLLLRLRETVRHDRPSAKFSVLVKAEGHPPATWEEWIASDTYANYMQDWIGWCREGAVDEIVLEVHERVAAQGNTLEEWVTFLNNNCHTATPIISIAGGLNFNEGLSSQYQMVRSRGIGVILYNYATPTRSTSRGFFSSLPNLVFNNAAGKALPRKPLEGLPEQRAFGQMINPPREFVHATPTPAFQNPLEKKPLVFATPSPVPTLTPVPKYVPEPVMRRIRLTSGVAVDAVVLEVTPTTIKIQPSGSPAMEFQRSRVLSVDPAL